ncbi:MAG: copper chaperone PCu(A)C [Burkholderiaceae bacterium]
MSRLIPALLFAALSSSAAAGDADVRVDHAWARATLPAQMASGAYMTVTSATPARIVGMSTPWAGVAQVHQMSLQGTTMKMRAVDALDLPAGKPVELTPGGYHVMLMDLKQPLKKGDKLPLTLRIEGANKKVTEQTVMVDVLDAPP